jgi:PBP1b-binding outer membrane lipoprotein LpoB
MPGYYGSIRASTAVLILFALLLAGCAASNPAAPGTPPAPTPPQVTAANAVNALAQVLDTAVTALQTAQKNGQISAADLANAEKVAGIIATAGKSIDAELRSADAWTAQKTAIVKIISSSGLAGALQNLPPTAGAIVSAGVALWNQIATSVGGPTV